MEKNLQNPPFLGDFVCYEHEKESPAFSDGG